MPLSRIRIVFAAVFCSVSAFTHASFASASANVIDQLINALPGPWDGRAIETPVGPVDYAIDFHQCEKDAIAGVAELNVSDHHWRFWRSDGELRLTFLSTFRGNQQPTQLQVTKTEENTIWFHAPELSVLTLSVAIAEPDIDIRVFHHHKPHVYIRLTRSDRQSTDQQRTDNWGKSCRKL